MAIQIRKRIREGLEVSGQATFASEAVFQLGQMEPIFHALDHEPCGQCGGEEKHITSRRVKKRDSQEFFEFSHIECNKCGAQLGVVAFGRAEINRNPDKCGSITPINGWHFYNGEKPAKASSPGSPAPNHEQSPF